jgi:N-acetylneuraminic acid mutarotase
MIEARVWHSATLLPDGSVLVVGGSGNLREAELFYPSTRNWIATGSTSTPEGSGHTATLLLDGRVLVAGGNPGSEFDSLAAAELYDPTTGRWTITASMTTTRSWHTATLLADGRVLVVGGGSEERREEGPYRSATAELYETSTGRWTATATMTAPRFGHTATLLPDGKVLVAGGDPGDGTIALSAELYDPSSGRWTATGSMAEARGSGHTATLLPDSTVLVAGGVGPGSDPIPVASAELYDPRSGRWTAAGSMAEARGFWSTATLLLDGRVLVAGGFLRSPLASAELFDPGQR